MDNPVKYCPKHRIKMTLLFTSYVCDVCDPPKNMPITEKVKRPVAERTIFKVGDRVRDKATWKAGWEWVGMVEKVTAGNAVQHEICRVLWDRSGLSGYHFAMDLEKVNE